MNRLKLAPANAGAGASAQAGGMVASSAAGTGGGIDPWEEARGRRHAVGSGRRARIVAVGGSGRVSRRGGEWRQPGAAVPLGELADVRVTTGPPMIEDGTAAWSAK